MSNLKNIFIDKICPASLSVGENISLLLFVQKDRIFRRVSVGGGTLTSSLQSACSQSTKTWTLLRNPDFHSEPQAYAFFNCLCAE